MTLAAVVSLPQRVDAVLEGFLHEQERFWSGTDRRPVLTAVRRFVLNGGKRFRPAFCYWGYRGAAGAQEEGLDDVAVVAGAALELFHCFALIHDDIIDGSSRRRGEPSVHEDFAAQHVQRNWHGDPALFGRSIALLCGDLCAAWADQLFGRCGASARRLREAQELFAAARAEAIAGEHLDVVAQAVGDHGSSRAVTRALQVARLKTARYSIARPLQIGGILGGADAQLLYGYAAVGDPLGEAFQLRDDVLGVFGDPERTGKSALDDLRQGKLTVLLALTFARADQRQLKVLRSLIGNAELDEEGAEMIRSIMVQSGALEATEQRISQGYQLALRAIDALHLGDEAQEALIRLANFATDRAS